MKKIFLIALLLNLASMGQLHAQLFGGQLKSPTTPYPGGTVHCNPQNRTDVVPVTSTTGQIWMDRNLGADQVASSSQDPLSYGDLYQWGRGSDGHQCRNSSTQTGLSSSDVPGHGNFITTTNSPLDWRNSKNDNLWQGIAGINNPCPKGFRIPTQAEFTAEIVTWTTNGENDDIGAFNSVLKLPSSGFRNNGDGVVTFTSLGIRFGIFWSSTIDGGSAQGLAIRNTTSAIDTYIGTYNRSRGYSVRCIKN